MKIIGISGGSGAGKSTVSRRLTEVLPNSILVSVDPFVYEETIKLEPEILRAMGEEKKQGEYALNYFFKSFETTKIWVDMIQNGVVNKIEKAVYEQGKDKDYVVVDWCFLPMCDFFKKCDFTVNVKTDFKKEVVRLSKRMENIQVDKNGVDRSLRAHKPGILENRIKFTTLSDYGFQSQFEITNDGELEYLYGKIDELASTLMNGKTHLERFFQYK